MPAHCSRAQVGRKRLSDRSFLSDLDLEANSRIDLWAKQAAREFELPVAKRREIVKASDLVTTIATWIGRCVEAANHFPFSPAEPGGNVRHFRDTEAAPRSRKVKAHAPVQKLEPEVQPAEVRLQQCPRWEALRLCIVSRGRATNVVTHPFLNGIWQQLMPSMVA